MPIEAVPGTDLTYQLVAFDAAGTERTDPSVSPSGLLSERIVAQVASEPITDIFLLGIGWRGDLPAARQAYAGWIGAMADCREDVARMREARPGFRPLLVGLHWPSEPWSRAWLGGGDQWLGGIGASSAGAGLTTVGALVEDAAARVADTPAARAALRTIFSSAFSDPSPPTLPPPVREMYAVLEREAGLASGGPGARPGDDTATFNAQRIFEAFRLEGAAFGETLAAEPGGPLLAPLQVLALRTMRARACRVGEHGVHSLLVALQRAAGNRDVRVHLVGHSFDAVTMTAAVAGPPGSPPLPRPIASLVLVQGALSIWSFSPDRIPGAARPGYFRSVVVEDRVAGPIVATWSVHDTVLADLYPLANGLRAAARPAIPDDGAVGAHGIQGLGLGIADVELGGRGEPYEFGAGTIWNVDASGVIRDGGDAPEAAHADVYHAEVAHLVWAAAGGPPARASAATSGPAGDSGAADDALVTFNGVDGATGAYLVPPIPLDDLARDIVEQFQFERAHLADLRAHVQDRRAAF